jgi:hypothetical protein
MVTQKEYDDAMAKASIASFQESADFVAELEADLVKANSALEQVLDANEPSEAAYELIEDIELAIEHYKDEPRVPVSNLPPVSTLDELITD